MHPKYNFCNNYNTQKKIYTISGRTVNAVINDTIDILMGYYQVNNEVMEDKEKIKCLENIVDLIKISENI